VARYVQARRHPPNDVRRALDALSAVCRHQRGKSARLVALVPHPADLQLIYYSPSLFRSLGLDYERQLTLSGIMNVIQLAAVIAVVPFLDRVGRRPPLLVGSAGMSVCHIVVAVVIARYAHDWAAHATQAWVGVGFILAFMFCFGIGWA
jgi:MFS family permease